MNEKCILDPERDCLGLIKARELEGDLNELRKQNAASHERLFDRLGELERQEGIQGEQYKNIIDKLGNLTTNISEMKADNKEIISQLPSLTHKVETLEQLSEDVAELKEKPAKKWDGMTEKIISIVVSAVVGFLLAKIGLA